MRINRAVRLIALLVACIAGGVHGAAAQQPEIFQARRADYAAAPLAVSGFDTVAYHTQKAAVPGNPQFRVSWKGAEWQFASQANVDLFLKEPDKYAPQYGGYCAFAVALGSAASSDPRLFDVIDGKLYLNQSNGTQASWRRDTAGMIQRGNQNWPRVIGR